MGKMSYLDLLAKHKVSSAHPGGFALTGELLKDLPVNTGAIVLDVGCGTGQTSAYMANAFNCRVFAVDKNLSMFELASQRFQRENLDIKLFHASAMQLPFQSEFFDIVVSESVTVFTDIMKALTEYTRTLKKGGSLLAIEITAESRLNQSEAYRIKSVYGINYVPTEAEWFHMMRLAGFKDVKVYKINLKPEFKMVSSEMARDFYNHFYTISYLQDKLGYKIYKCIL